MFLHTDKTKIIHHSLHLKTFLLNNLGNDGKSRLLAFLSASKWNISLPVNGGMLNVVITVK